MEKIIKKVTYQISGTGGDYGRVYLPKRFIGKIVLIKVLGKNEIEKWEKQKRKIELEKNKRKIKLENHLNKLRKIRYLSI